MASAVSLSAVDRRAGPCQCLRPISGGSGRGLPPDSSQGPFESAEPDAVEFSGLVRLGSKPAHLFWCANQQQHLLEDLSSIEQYSSLYYEPAETRSIPAYVATCSVVRSANSPVRCNIDDFQARSRRHRIVLLRSRRSFPFEVARPVRLRHHANLLRARDGHCSEISLLIREYRCSSDRRSGQSM